jgi:hypothetical protein
MGPSKVLACHTPNTYIPATWRVFPEFNLNVERLRRSAGRDPPSAADSEETAAPAVQELFKFLTRMSQRYGRPHVLVRWAGRDASGNTWKPLGTNCEAALLPLNRPPAGRCLRQHRLRLPSLLPRRRRCPGRRQGSPSTRRRRATWRRRS